MAQIKRSFRAFGPFRLYRPHYQAANDFDWDTKDQTAANVVEIFRVKDGGIWRAFARFSVWTGGTFPGLPQDVPDSADNIFIKGRLNPIFDALMAIQPGKGAQSVSFWIHNPYPASRIRGHVLRVMDLMALDHFLPDPQAPDRDRLDARVPLRRRYRFDGHENGSILTFGSSLSYELRIEVGIPLVSGLGLDCDVLAMGGLFDTSDKNESRLYRPTMVLAGPPDGTSASVLNVSDLFGDVAASRLGGAGYLPIRTALPATAVDQRQFLSGLGLAPPRPHRTEYAEVLAGVGEVPTVSVSLRHKQTRPGPDDWPLLGARNPRLSAKSFQTQLIATCTLSDDTIKQSLVPGPDGADADSNLSWTLRILARWTSELEIDDHRVPLDPPTPDGHVAGGLKEALRMATRARHGLVATDRQPQSVLPRFYWPHKSRDQVLPFISYGQTDGFDVTGALGEAVTLISRGPAPSARQPLDFVTTLDTQDPDAPRDPAHLMTPPGRKWRAAPGLAAPVDVTMYLPAFADRILDTTPAQGFPIQLMHHAEAPRAGTARAQVKFAIRNNGDAAKLLAVRLGSLAMEGANALLHDGTKSAPPGQLIVRSTDQEERDMLPDAYASPGLDTEWQFRFGLADAYPQTVDIPHGDRTSRPSTLLMRSARLTNDDAAQGAPVPLALTVTERLRDDQDRHLQAHLADTSSGKEATHAVTVLTDNPFSVYRYARQGFADAGSDAAGEVAIYDSDTRQWRQQSAADTYLMIRPPGAVGEDADKPARLELHDGDKDGDGPLLPPLNGVARRRVVDMRLSPPTAMWVRPTDLARNYVLPEYAARELFRQPGDFGLGVSLAGLRSEALYGLSLGLLVPRERDGQIAPRVAELDALVGQMVLPDDGATSDRDKRWAALHPALRKRPEHLEVWRLDPSARSPFVPARFDSGLTFAMRRSAQLRGPVEDVRSFPQVPADAPLQPPQFSDQGLSGGVLWPIESANVARLLGETIVGDGGELDRIALSPLGISADQTVQFRGGYARIITETRQGRLHKQRVEILGRIGVLWHRAKHVIIYERTTAPSPQFTPDHLGSRSRRAVLRKVSEFIEILEPSRRYPDMPGADPKSRGFLREVRFNSRTINVDSAWGRDLGNYGWEVALWNRGAAERRPQVYPQPDIAFVTAAEGAAVADETAQDCRDPHLLYFYTDVEQAAAQSGEQVDTDRWPARTGVDHSVMGLPEVQFKHDAASVKAVVDKQTPVAAGERRPLPSRLSFGLRRFTWRVAPSQTRTRLNAELGRKPVFAGLESVSFMRDIASDSQTDATGLNTIKAAVKGAVTPAALGDGVVLPRPVAASPQGVLQEHKQLVETAATLPPELDPIKDFKDDVASFQTGLTAQVTALGTYVLGRDVTAELGNLQTKLNGNDIVKLLKDADEKTCAEWGKRAKTAIERRRLVLMQAVRQVEAEVLADLDQLVPLSKEAAKTLIRDRISEEIGDLTAEVGSALSGAEDGLAIARDVIGDWRADARAALSRAAARVEEAAAALEPGKPWSRSRLDAALAQLDRQFGDMEKEANAALDEARQRLSTELNAEARTLSGLVGASVRSVLQSGAAGLGRIDSVQALLIAQNTRFKRQIAQLPTSDDPRLVELGKKAVAAGATAEAAFETLKSALDGLEKKKKDASAAAKALVGSATATLGDVQDAAKNALRNVKGEADDIKTLIAQAVAQFETDLGNAHGDLKTLIGDFKSATDTALDGIGALAAKLCAVWQDIYALIAAVVRDYADHVQHWITTVDAAMTAGFGAADQWLGRFQGRIEVIKTQLPVLVREVLTELVKDAVNAVIDPLDWPDSRDLEANKRFLGNAATSTTEQIEEMLQNTAELTEDQLKPVKEACDALMGVKARLMEGADAYIAQLEQDLAPVVDGLKTLADEAYDLIAAGQPVGEKLRDIAAQGLVFAEALEGAAIEFAAAGEHARSYFTGGLERAVDIFKAKPGAVPGRALELLNFLSHSPEIASLRTNADRARVYLDRAEEVLNTPTVQASLDYLGDALKALGLDFDFDELGDVLKLKLEQGGKDLKSLIRQFGGVDLSNLLPDVKLPGDPNKYVQVTHDLDTKVGRAWVQADVNVDLAGRNRMFSVGPFTLFITRSRLAAFVRAEASKDQPDVEVTDMSRLITDLEAVIGGQVMVTLKDVVISYSRETELDFQVDPSKIKINKSMRFIQDTLSALFPDMPSGLSYLRAPDDGAIVGVEHSFNIPPISLNYGTSGVSNIQIGNRFSLTAFPDFMIANRFNLSRREVPFIFSVFIIGGTGYLQVDTEYRPVDGELMVAVEAGVGGSAALAFSFGPVSGGVYITLTVVLRYVKRLGAPQRPGDGLSVAVVLVIAGQVSLWGMVTIYLGLMLSMTYHESGSIDAMGQLSVEVRISRWFKLKYSTQVTYRLREGKETTTRTETVSASGEAVDKLKKLNKARKSI